MRLDNKLLLVFAAAVISGFSIFVNRFGVRVFDPYIFTGLKNIAVAIFLVAIVLLVNKWHSLKLLKPADWLRLAIIGLVGGSIPFLLFFKGLSITSASSGSFVHKTMFLFVFFLAVFFLKEKLTKAMIFSSLLLLAGNFLLLRLSGFTLGTGELLILAATVLWACETVISKKVMERLPANIVACGRMLFGSAFIIMFLAATGRLEIISQINPQQLFWVAVTSILLLLYVFTWYNGLKNVQASTATAVLLVGSVVTTLLDLVFVGRMILLGEAVGGALVIAGVLLLVFRNKFTFHNFSTAKAK